MSDLEQQQQQVAPVSPLRSPSPSSFVSPGPADVVLPPAVVADKPSSAERTSNSPSAVESGDNAGENGANADDASPQKNSSDIIVANGAESDGGSEVGEGDEDSESNSDAEAERRRLRDANRRWLDIEAEEASEEEEVEGSTASRPASKRRTRLRRDDEEEDEDEEELEGEFDDFLGEDLEGDEESTMRQRRRRKRRLANEELELDEEDLALIEQNTGVRLQRREQQPELTRLKRRRVGASDSEEEDMGDGIGGPAAPIDAAAAVAAELFGDAEGGGLEELLSGDEEVRRSVEGSSEDEEVEEDDDEREGGKFSNFIVDDETDEQYDNLFDTREYEMVFQQQQLVSEADADHAGLATLSGPGGQAVASQFALYRQRFEPSELARRYMTVDDERIVMTDVPERFQLGDAWSQSSAVVPSDSELREEAEWIFSNWYQTRPTKEQLTIDAIIPRILRTLEFIRKEHFEAPFIMQYRKDYVMPLTIDDLWGIADADTRWISLRRRRAVARTLLQQRVDEDMLVEDVTGNIVAVSGHTRVRGLFESFLNRPESGLREVQDAMDKLQLMFPAETTSTATTVSNAVVVHDQGAAQQRRSVQTLRRATGARRTAHQRYADSKIRDFIKFYGLTSAQFAENVEHDSGLHMIDEDPNFEPRVAAVEFMDALCPTVDSVLSAARALMAAEIAAEPDVRRSVRDFFERYATITTTPTVKGLAEIDATHPYRQVLSLRGKPRTAFLRWQMLLIRKAEREGYVTVELGVPAGATTRETYTQQLIMHMRSEGHTPVAELWNAERAMVVRHALDTHLFPHAANHLRSVMIDEACDRLGESLSHKFNEMLMAGPFMPNDDMADDEDEDEFGTSATFNIIGVCVGSTVDREASMCVVIDTNGDILAHVQLNNTRQSKEEDMESVRSLVLEHRPRVIGVGAHSESTRVYDELHKLVMEMRDSGDLERRCHVCYVDESVPRIYEASRRSREEFASIGVSRGSQPTGAPAQYRRAVGVARQLQDPLLAYSGLFNADNDILALHLLPLQEELPKERLLRLLERVAISVTCLVGVDVSAAIAKPHRAGTLQFVAGLGPRKAAALVRSAYGLGTKLRALNDLEPLIGKCCFTNAAGFLRLPKSVSALDRTRIHPEDFSIATRIAADALDEVLNDEEDNSREVVDQILRKPEKLEDIDLDALAKVLSSSGVRKLATLYDIKGELQSPFADPRIRYTDPKPERVFEMITGLSLAPIPDNSLPRGLPVDVKVMNVDDSHARCLLLGYGGVVGILRAEFATDNPAVQSMADLNIERGMVLRCRVKSDFPDVGRFTVDLTCRSSDLQAENEHTRAHLNTLHHLEPYMASSLPDSAELNGATISKRAPRAVFARAVDHYLFHNFSHREAETWLEEEGDAAVAPYIVRPSSVPDRLTISWRVHKDVVVHIPVEERDKPAGFALGRKLVVGAPFIVASADDAKAEAIFEDLDDLDANFMSNLVSFANELKEHRKFVDLRRDAVDIMLKREKSANMALNPYHLSVVGGGQSKPPAPGEEPIEDDEETRRAANEREAPWRSTYLGYFWLSYLPGLNKVKHETIRIVTDGFRFRNRTFRSVDRLIEWFKKNHDKDQRQPSAAQPSIPSAAGGSQAAQFQADLARLGAAVGSITGAGYSAPPMPSYAPPPVQAYAAPPISAGGPYGGSYYNDQLQMQPPANAPAGYMGGVDPRARDPRSAPVSYDDSYYDRSRRDRDRNRDRDRDRDRYRDPRDLRDRDHRDRHYNERDPRYRRGDYY